MSITNDGSIFTSFRPSHPSDLYFDSSIDGWEAAEITSGGYIEIWDDDPENVFDWFVELQSHEGSHGIKQQFQMLPSSQLTFILAYKGRYDLYDFNGNTDNAFSMKVEGASELLIDGVPATLSSGVLGKSYMDDEDFDTDATPQYPSWTFASVTITAGPDATNNDGSVDVTLSLVPNHFIDDYGNEVTYGGFVQLLKMDVEWISKDEANNPIDDNPNTGGDNFDDYLNTPKSGQFVLGSASSPTATVTLDVDGEAEIDFQVGMQPGNNYRVVAVIKDIEGNYDQLQINDATTIDTFVSAGNEQLSGFTGAGAASSMLTVWRKLHIEQDSMEELPDPLSRHDQSTLENLSWGDPSTSGQQQIVVNSSIPFSGTLPDRFYRDGYAWPVGESRESAYEVFWNIRNVNSQDVTIIGHPTSAQKSIETWNIVDDDSRGLDSNILPRFDLLSASVKQKYEPAYITLVDADTLDLNSDKSVTLEMNFPWVSETYNTSSMNSSENLSEHAHDKAFWNQLLVAAYQGRSGYDLDPQDEAESVNAGVNVDNVFSPSYAVVFLEGARETYYANFRSTMPENLAVANELFAEEVSKIIAHEIAHSPEGASGVDDHDEGGLMDSDYVPSGFSDLTIIRLRSADKWR